MQQIYAIRAANTKTVLVNAFHKITAIQTIADDVEHLEFVFKRHVPDSCHMQSETLEQKYCIIFRNW